jgi:stage V sporulation protein R
MDYADRTLRYIHRLWGRAVHLETILDDKQVVVTFDGDRSRTKVGETVKS